MGQLKNSVLIDSVKEDEEIIDPKFQRDPDVTDDGKSNDISMLGQKKPSVDTDIKVSRIASDIPPSKSNSSLYLKKAISFPIRSNKRRSESKDYVMVNHDTSIIRNEALDHLAQGRE